MNVLLACRLGRGSPRRPLLVLSTAALLATSLLSVAPSPARPTPASGEPAQSSAAGADPAGWDGPAGSVTLITGDTVSVDGEGRVSVEAGPGREQIDFREHRGQDSLRVVPADAARLVAADRLDARLFDISYLLSEGYGDQRRGSLPLLVDGQAAPVREVVSGPGARVTDRLPLTGFSVVSQGRGSASGALWRRATDTNDTGRLVLEPGLEKVWLDGMVHATLEDSVPQIGAPEVWASGHTGEGVKVAVLDTGIDGRHPDLAGQVVANQVFSISANSGLFDVEGLDDPVAYLGVDAALPAPKTGSSDPLVDVGRACVETGGDQLTGDPAGKTALIVRGLCPFAEKYDAAVEAGATGVVFYNDVAGSLRATIAGAEHAGQVWAAGITDIDGAALVDLLETGEPVNLGFTDLQNPGDLLGHGTHVAATIAGTGAGSDGLRKGVAPDATIMNGKVLSDSGSGEFSWVMAGMEWAAANGADVINMSLGAGPTDGTDPMSQTVNTLTAEHDVLFVISAGNSGAFGQGTVGTPGAADDALTVGAVDKQDLMAYFSSRGPRLGDFAVKPNITAPGVDIVAARATGTNLGPPVDDAYTSLSGTSMAAPHVAGAAALLAQARPELGALALKDALASTSVDGGGLWLDEGAGRVDVARAVSQGVYADASVNFGNLAGQDNPVDRHVTYVNHTDRTVRLQLQATLTDIAGTEGDGLTLSAQRLTVRPHREATVTVTADPQAIAPRGSEVYGGVITAVGTDISVRTAVGLAVSVPAIPLGDDWNENRTNTYHHAEGELDCVFNGMYFNGSEMSPDGQQIFITGAQEGSPACPGSVAKPKITTAAVDADTGEEIWVANHYVDYPGMGVQRGGRAPGVAISPDASKVFVAQDVCETETVGGCVPASPNSRSRVIAYNNASPGQSEDPELGEQLWQATLPIYSNSVDITVAPDGNTVLLVGETMGDGNRREIFTAAFDTMTGERTWQAQYRKPDAIWAAGGNIAVNPSGSLAYVTGVESKVGGVPAIPVTIAYELSGESAGQQRWIVRGDEPTGNYGNWHNSVSADGSRLFVVSTADNCHTDPAGGCQTPEPYNSTISTQAYDAATGELVWSSQFGGVDHGYSPGHTEPNRRYKGSIAVSPNNDRVFITGMHCEGGHCTGEQALVTVAYDQQTGEELWSQLHQARVAGSREDLGRSVAVSPDGTRVYVAGMYGPLGLTEQVTMAYDAATGEHLAVARQRFVEDHNQSGNRVFVSPDSGTVYTVGEAFPLEGHGFWTLSTFSPPIPLDVSPRRSNGVWLADLTWSGITADDVDVYRDGEVVATVADTGSYTDTLGRPRAGTTFVYKVCAAGTETCSKEQPVTIAAKDSGLNQWELPRQPEPVRR